MIKDWKTKLIELICTIFAIGFVPAFGPTIGAFMGGLTIFSFKNTYLVTAEKPLSFFFGEVKNGCKFSPQMHELCYNIVENRAVGDTYEEVDKSLKKVLEIIKINTI